MSLEAFRDLEHKDLVVILLGPDLRQPRVEPLALSVGLVPSQASLQVESTGRAAVILEVRGRGTFAGDLNYRKLKTFEQSSVA